MTTNKKKKIDSTEPRSIRQNTQLIGDIKEDQIEHIKFETIKYKNQPDIAQEYLDNKFNEFKKNFDPLHHYSIHRQNLIDEIIESKKPVIEEEKEENNQVKEMRKQLFTSVVKNQFIIQQTFKECLLSDIIFGDDDNQNLFIPHNLLIIFKLLNLALLNYHKHGYHGDITPRSILVKYKYEKIELSESKFWKNYTPKRWIVEIKLIESLNPALKIVNHKVQYDWVDLSQNDQWQQPPEICLLHPGLKNYEQDNLDSQIKTNWETSQKGMKAKVGTVDPICQSYKCTDYNLNGKLNGYLPDINQDINQNTIQEKIKKLSKLLRRNRNKIIELNTEHNQDFYYKIDIFSMGVVLTEVIFKQSIFKNIFEMNFDSKMSEKLGNIDFSERYFVFLNIFLEQMNNNSVFRSILDKRLDEFKLEKIDKELIKQILTQTLRLIIIERHDTYLLETQMDKSIDKMKLVALIEKFEEFKYTKPENDS